MYNPFMPVIAQEDRIGNLQLWKGTSHIKPKDDNEIFYIQTSQTRSDIYANCFGLTEEEKNEIERGWEVQIYLHEDYVYDLFYC